MNLMETHRDKLRLATIVLLCLVNHRLRPLRLADADATRRRGGHVLCRRGDDDGTVPSGQAGGSARAHRATAFAADLPADPPDDPSDTAALVRGMLCQSRHALLLRKQVVGNLDEDQFHETCEQLYARMAMVPEGDVVLRQRRRRARTKWQVRPGRNRGTAHARRSLVPRSLSGHQSAVLTNSSPRAAMAT